MSDMTKGFLITLNKNYGSEDTEDILTAIRMIKGVSSIEKIPINPSDCITENRIRRELQTKLFKVIMQEE
jgi:hypothetical protein